jgi:peptidoglycan hydrolase-like protein with peptidoglycan-binding domain
MKGKFFVFAVVLFAGWSIASADPAIQSAQQKLKDGGFYYGEITGEKDAETTAAIRRYQIRNGLHITGQLDAETQKSLGVTSQPGSTPRPRPVNTPPPRTPDSPSETHPPKNTTVPPDSPSDLDEADDAPENDPGPREPGPENANLFAETPFASAPPDVQRRIIISVQIALMREGYYRAGIDGVYGSGMNLALRAYQDQIGLPPTGLLDRETLASLDLLPRHRMRGPRPFHPRMYPPRSRIGPSGEIIYVPR